MLVCIAEACLLWYMFYFETKWAKRYERGSDTFLFFNIFNQGMQSQNDKGGMVCEFIIISCQIFIFEMWGQRLQCH